MSVQIHGKEYITVAERLDEAHKANKEGFDVFTEVLETNPIVIKATVTINGKSYTGISAANPMKAIEKQSPYEVAETSAVGRALGFAGYGAVDSIASADEMKKGGYDTLSDLVSPSNLLATTSGSNDTLPLDADPFEDEHLCKKCGGPTSIRESRSANNPGRPYYACRVDKFSHWVNQEVLST